jgi:hypothetical protein
MWVGTSGGERDMKSEIDIYTFLDCCMLNVAIVVFVNPKSVSCVTGEHGQPQFIPFEMVLEWKSPRTYLCEYVAHHYR